MDCGFIENKNLCENNNNSSDKTIKQKQWRTTYEQVEICPLRSYGNETVINSVIRFIGEIEPQMYN